MEAVTPEAMLKQARLSGLSPSPEGRRLAFAQKQYDWATSKWSSEIWLHDRQTGLNSRLTSSYNDNSPVWLSEEIISFLSDRNGITQIWQANIENGDNLSALTVLPLPIDSYKVHRGLEAIFFTTRVVPGSEDPFQATLDYQKAIAERKSNFLKLDRLFARRWDSWDDRLYSKLFVQCFRRTETLFTMIAKPKMLMPLDKLREQCPVPPFGDNSHYDISPDGDEIAYCSHAVHDSSEQAWSTFVSTKLVPISVNNGTIEIGTAMQIPHDSEGYNENPRYSPDGKYIAFSSMKRACYEADWNRLAIFDREKTQLKVLEKAPVSVSGLAWSPESTSVLITGNHQARINAYEIPIDSDRQVEVIDVGGEIHDIAVFNTDTGKTQILYLKNSVAYPDRVFIDKKCIVDPNEAAMKTIKIAEPTDMWFNGANGDKVHAYILKPYGFSAERKYPLAVIIHGGPQGCNSDSWHYRWNLAVFAGAGYGVLAVNFHGSTGFGQEFCDSIRGDWGGKPYDDIMLGIDHALEQFSWIDQDRIGALGASFGGYMINWINGHSTRFKCLVNHDGLFNTEAMYYSTEELYFMENDFEGTPWKSPKFQAMSPHMFVEKWATPTLVIHGGKDYRVVDVEGLSTFTALQRRGIPSELLYFPEENHWVLNPNNRYEEFAETITAIDCEY